MANEGPSCYSDSCEIGILTLTKLEVKFKSRISLKTLLWMINVLSKYHFIAITCNFKSDSN